MTYSPTADSFTSDHETIRRSVLPTAGVIGVASGLLTAWGAHDMRETLVVLGVIVATLAGVYGFVLPKALSRESAPRTALTLSVLAVS